MLPFSFSEMVTYAGIEVRKISHTAQMGGVETLFNEYMQFGGFPKVIQTSNTYEKLDTLQEYYTTMFYRDLLERYSIGDKQALEYLMKYLLSLFSSLFSL
jgi:predicted AAA+ superfamily ATPase